MEFSDFNEVIAALLAGGLGKYLIDRFIRQEHYKNEVKKAQLENDALASTEWKRLYDELKLAQDKMDVKLKELELECAKLRNENISLKQQFEFTKAIDDVPDRKL